MFGSERIDQCLKGWIEKSGASGELKQAAEYALFPGGKRIRPLCLIALLEDLGGDPELGLDAGCALELIHTYSLIHDDLPCMDDDDYRRGKPSLHKAFPQATAVLTGDFFLTFAFEILAKSDLSAEKRILLIQILSESSGAKGLVEGQILDLSGSGDFLTCNRLKTGALFACAFMFAAVLAEKPLEPFKNLGEQYGLLYQWFDDLEDGDADAYEMNNDLKEFMEKTLTYKNLQQLIKVPEYVPN